MDRLDAEDASDKKRTPKPSKTNSKIQIVERGSEQPSISVNEIKLKLLDNVRKIKLSKVDGN